MTEVKLSTKELDIVALRDISRYRYFLFPIQGRVTGDGPLDQNVYMVEGHANRRLHHSSVVRLGEEDVSFLKPEVRVIRVSIGEITAILRYRRFRNSRKA